MWITPSARITGDKDRENPVEGAHTAPSGDVERVARAIHAAHMIEKGPLAAWTWEEAAKPYYVGFAKAAIAAMREQLVPSRGGRSGSSYQIRHHGRLRRCASSTARCCHSRHLRVSDRAPRLSVFALSSCPVCRSPNAAISPIASLAGSGAPGVSFSRPDASSISPQGSASRVVLIGVAQAERVAQSASNRRGASIRIGG